jgi:hypothetical protein
MGLADKPGTMGRKLRELEVTNDGGLRLIIQALLEPSTQMVDAAWREREILGPHGTPPVFLYQAMLRAALKDLIDDAAQHADTDGLAKQHDILHSYLRAAGIEPEVEL